MFSKKICFFVNTNNFNKIILRSFSNLLNSDESPKFVVKKLIKRVPLRVKVVVKKLVPKVSKPSSTENVDNKCLTVEKIFKIKSIKRVVKSFSLVKKPLFLKKTDIKSSKIKTVKIRKKLLIPKFKKIVIKQVIKVPKKRIVKHTRVIKKLKEKKPKLRVLKKKLKEKKPKIKKVKIKKIKIKKKKQPKLIPLGPMPDFYKLKKTKKVSFIGISFRQNRRLVNKPWLKKKKEWLKKKRFKQKQKNGKKKIKITFRVNNRRRLKNGRKISKRNYIEKWKYVFLRRNRNRSKKRIHLFYNRKKNNTFITLTDGKGRVLVSQSAGYCKIKSKKKKRSPDTLKAIAYSVAKAARLKNIRYIYKMYSKNRHMKSRRAIFNEFKRAGLMILVNVIVKRRPHSLHHRRKKVKRL